jgi:hypothetical protein
VPFDYVLVSDETQNRDRVNRYGDRLGVCSRNVARLNREGEETLG